MSETSPLRLLLDQFSPGLSLRIAPGEQIHGRRDGRLIEFDSILTTEDQFDRLVTELAGAHEIVIEASSGWHRVALTDGALVTQSLVARDDVTHADPVVEATAGQLRPGAQLTDDPAKSHTGNRLRSATRALAVATVTFWLLLLGLFVVEMVDLGTAPGELVVFALVASHVSLVALVVVGLTARYRGPAGDSPADHSSAAQNT